MGWMAFVNDMSGVQFFHRNLAYVLTAAIIGLAIYARKKQQSQNLKLFAGQMNAMQLVVTVIIFQYALGVFTLIYGVPLVLGVLHQAGAFLLFTSIIYLLHQLKRQ